MADKFFSKFTGEETDKIIDGRYHSPIDDCVGDDWTIGSPLVASAGVEYDFVCNGNIRHFKVFPDHITKMWDTTLNIATFSEFLNTPEIVSTPQFTFAPTVAAAGTITVRAYVNEDTPLVIKEIVIPYKATVTDVSALLTYYAGDAVGFDVKNKGTKFTIEFSGAGNVYNNSIENYRT